MLESTGSQESDTTERLNNNTHIMGISHVYGLMNFNKMSTPM